MKFTGLCLILFSCVCTFSQRSFADGNDLLKQCMAAERFIDGDYNVEDYFHVGLCVGLIQGVRNTIQILDAENQSIACFPESGIDNDQSVRIINQYLKNNPAELHNNEVLLTMLAYAHAYPCVGEE